MKNLFKFIEDRYPEYPTPLKWKFLHDPESITEKDLNVRGYLYLENTKITQLPNDLKVGGDLWLSNTPITQLPNNLKVERYLFLKNTPLSKKYSKDQIKQIIEAKGGYVERNIYI